MTACSVCVRDATVALEAMTVDGWLRWSVCDPCAAKMRALWDNDPGILAVDVTRLAVAT